MARRPFDPAEHGWSRATYRRGDVLDRDSVDELVAGADVVVHLAFIIFSGREETHRVNLEGSRNVFEATAAAGARRLVYSSSVAAYGFPEGERRLTEDDEPRGTDRLYYSAQKAELEAALREAIASSSVEAYVFRPCIVAGADAPTLIVKAVDAVRLGGRLRPLGRVLGAIPGLRPVIPNNGVPFQLVHHDDVAAAIAAAVTGAGPPGAYNLAGPGELTAADLARELGWHSVPIPRAAVAATADVLGRIPGLPPEVAWLNALRSPVLMDCSRARAELGWEPRHDGPATLRETVAASRASGLL
jgi:nucleoside-diphosphate-sugar epimerase